MEIEKDPLNKFEKKEHKVLMDLVQSGKLLQILEKAKNLII